MSKLIPFPGAASQARLRPDFSSRANEILSKFFAKSSGVLLETIDGLGEAVDRLAALVTAMPGGKARDFANDQLRELRAQLETARSRSQQVARL